MKEITAYKKELSKENIPQHYTTELHETVSFSRS
jgi:hypothetical protein